MRLPHFIPMISLSKHGRNSIKNIPLERASSKDPRNIKLLAIDVEIDGRQMNQD